MTIYLFPKNNWVNVNKNKVVKIPKFSKRGQMNIKMFEFILNKRK